MNSQINTNMKFTDFISTPLKEAINYKEIVDDFDEIISAQSFSNIVTVIGKIKGKEETKRYHYRDPRVALEVSKKIKNFIGIK